MIETGRSRRGRRGPRLPRARLGRVPSPAPSWGRGRTGGPATSSSTRWGSPAAPWSCCRTPRRTSTPRARSARRSSPRRGSPRSWTWPPSATPGSPASRCLTHSPHPAGTLSARDRTLRNESIEVEFDAATGGLRSIRAPGDPIARLGQQLVITGHEGRPVVDARQRASPSTTPAPPWPRRRPPGNCSPRPAGGSPGSASGSASGSAGRSWSWTSTLTDLDPDVGRERLAGSDPWAHHLACRLAWPDPSGATLRRLCLLAPDPTAAPRPEDARRPGHHDPPAADRPAFRRARTPPPPRPPDARHPARSRERNPPPTSGSASSWTWSIPTRPRSGLLVPARRSPGLPPARPPPGPAGWFFTLDHPSVAVTPGLARPRPRGRSRSRRRGPRPPAWA